jgi:sulfonate transport system substrate-binding protein
VLPRSVTPILLVLALLAAGGSMSACGGDESAAAESATSLQDVTLRVGVQKDGVRSILEASGQLEDLPYEISFSTFTFGPPLVEAAGADKIDVAGVGSTPPIFGAAGGQDFKVVAAIRKRNHTDDALLVPKGSAVTDVAGLRRKRIAISKGSSAHGYILNVLRRAGLSQRDVQLVFLVPADALAAFSSGSVDAWAVWQPFVSQAVNDGARVITAGPPDEAGNSFEIASSKAVEDPVRRRALSDFLDRLRKAYAWAARHPDEWAAAWSKESQLPGTTTKPAVHEVLADLEPVTDDVIAAQQKLADVLVEEKVIPAPVDFHEIVASNVFEPAG